MPCKVSFHREGSLFMEDQLITGTSLRPVTDDDLVFLERVYGSTREDELAQVPDMPAAAKTAFIRHQFEAQHIYYRQVYPASDYSLILHEDHPIGRLYVERHQIPGTIRIIDIAILPEFRKKGIGTYWIRRLQEEAKQTGKTLSIHVEQFNPALNLYQRLGFRIIKKTHGVYLLMEWQPGE